MKKNLLLFNIAVLSIALFITSCTSSSDEYSAQENKPIRALLVTGGGWHDYETQTELLTQALSERIDIEWTVVMEGLGEPEHLVSTLQEDRWAEGFDVIVHNTGFGRVDDGDFLKHMVEHHEGTPAVLLHATIMSYRHAETSDMWFDFMGLKSTWHERRRTFPVENIATDHYIMQGFPEKWQPPTEDELYVVEEIVGDITPLLQAYGEETEGYHPIAWTYERNGTRVFSTTLGHNNDMFRQSEFIEMVTLGLLWAVEREHNI